MHYLSKFKRFEGAEINLFQTVTLLIGRNGSGKTNVIEGVDLLSNLAHGVPVHDIHDLGHGFGKFEIRGGLVACIPFGQDRFGLGFGATYKEDPLKYNIGVQVTQTGPQVAREILRYRDRTLIDAASKDPGDLLQVMLDNFKQGKNPKKTLSADRSVLSRYEEVADTLPDSEQLDHAVSVVRALRAYLKRNYVFDPNPRAMRNYERIGNTSLARDGSNISAVLYGLQQSSEETLTEIVNTVTQLPEEPFVEIGFVVTALNDVLVGFKDRDGQLIDGRLLSDGTLRTLAVMTALHTVDPQSRVVIEEFDNGVHPSRVKLLIDEVFRVCKARKLNALITTHNPRTLDLLSNKQLESVVLCYFDSKSGHSALARLVDVPGSDIVFESGQLGDLVSHGTLERFVSGEYMADRRATTMEWLKKLKNG